MRNAGSPSGPNQQNASQLRVPCHTGTNDRALHLQHNCGRGEINPSNSSQFIAINSNGDVETISWSTIEYVQFTDGLYSFTGSEIGDALAAASDRLASLVIGDFRGVTLAAAMNSASLSDLGEGNVRENRFTHKALGLIDLGEAHAIDGAVVDVVAEPDASRGTLVAGVDAEAVWLGPTPSPMPSSTLSGRARRSCSTTP